MEAGFDYAEVPASTVVSDNWPKGAEATNLFVFSDLLLVGPSRGDVRAYGQELIPRAAERGVQTMVVGSGNARRCPEGYPIEKAHEEFYEAAAIWSEIGASHGVTIAPESLRREETNVGNDLGVFAKALAARGVAFTVDTYHVLAQASSNWQEEIPFKPAHVHLASKPRTWSVSELGGFVERLRELGYDGRVSYEGSWGDFEAELPLALAEIKALFTKT